ncbi:SMP-30/gluconolactonase/LRE family protein [Pendulispora rubella]|uniref:SMP-30/gluconolactonase/LRE family protein n=1 Tax=Pendulispora rubella TaxID=2741070 RepID=A0ABZ2KYX2_9BACT
MGETSLGRSLLSGLSYPESPRWRDGLLWISDVHNFRLKAFDSAGALRFDLPVPERPAGLGFLPDGQLLIATALGRRVYLVTGIGGEGPTGALQLVEDLSAHTRGLLNDMVVDRAGRAYVGDTGFNLGAGEAHRPGQIFLVEQGRTARCVVDDIDFPNGMALTPDGGTLYVAETFAHQISAFTVRADGSLSQRKMHARVVGTPDGICLDAEGALWVATLKRGEFQRIAANGRLLEHIDVTPAHSVACALGGPDRTALYLCFATVEDDGQGGFRRQGFVRCLPASVAGAGLP